MLNSNNLLILKKYKDSRLVTYAYTDKIFKTFISDLYYGFNKNNMDENDYKKLFVHIFVDNIIMYLYA